MFPKIINTDFDKLSLLLYFRRLSLSKPLITNITKQSNNQSLKMRTGGHADNHKNKLE